MTPLINGINYAWANITMVLFGVPVVGITKIDYKTKQNKTNNYGHGQYAISRGYGNYEPDGSIELYVDEWKRIIAGSPNRNPLQIPPFDVPIVYGGTGVQGDKDVLRAVEFMEDPLSASQGDTKLLVTIPLIIGLIDR